MVSKRDKVKLQLVEFPEKSVTVIVTKLSWVRIVPIKGVWVIIVFTSQLSTIVIKDEKSVTINSQLESKYLFTFNGYDNIGLMVSNNVRLKLQLEKFPEESVIVRVIKVSEFIKDPIAGFWEITGFKSQLSENDNKWEAKSGTI